MSLLDQQAFLSTLHPFNLLDNKELKSVIDSADIAYYGKDEVLISPKLIPEFLFIVIKGAVHEFDGDDELVSSYHSMDSFDANTLIYNKSENSFKVYEELICYELPKALFMQLIDQNQSFKNYFLEDITTKIQTLKNQEQSSEFATFMVARVYESFLHPATIVSPDTTILKALQQKEGDQSSCILVQHLDQTLSIVTDSNLRTEVLLKGRCSLDAPVGDIAYDDVITIDYHDFLFNALLLLTKHTIKRLIVMKDGQIAGVLEQLDLLSFFSNQSHLIVVQIEKAQTVSALKAISIGLINLIKALYAKGVKVRYITKLVSELNIKIYRKLLTLIVPNELLDHAVLIVMGSEGRQEQILKTDQDNALIIENQDMVSVFAPYMQTFTKTLIEFGFPECPGNIMVSNPYWSKEAKAYKSEIDKWIDHPSDENLMYLAIFFDSTVVVGNRMVYDDLRTYLFDQVRSNQHLLPIFAKNVLSFETPIGLFSDFIVDSKKKELDIKKGGIFPIVHGIRSLALEHGLEQTNTIERIKTLNDKGVLDREFSEALIEAYDTFLDLRLRMRLQKMVSGDVLDNFINPKLLGKIERDMLKESFKVVAQLKKVMTFHFHLENVT
jgi:CBS domain-containing protein